MHGLTFATLRAANMARLPQFKNAAGETAHAQTDGSDWTPNDWMVAVVGEVGEACNIMKKARRGDYATQEERAAARAALEKELADVVTYLDLLAYQFRIDLGRAVVEKFNEVSKRVGADIFLSPSGAAAIRRTVDGAELIVPQPFPALDEIRDTMRAGNDAAAQLEPAPAIEERALPATIGAGDLDAAAMTTPPAFGGRALRDLLGGR